jgi:hypothetical protein
MNFLKKKKQGPSVPRSIEELNKELNQESWALGQLEYQTFIIEKAIKEKLYKMEQLNLEGAERKRLDAVAANTPAETKENPKEDKNATT